MSDEEETFMFADDDEGYAEGDTDLNDIDWAQVEELERRQSEVLALPDTERPMAMLGLLDEMYEGNVEIL